VLITSIKFEPVCPYRLSKATMTTKPFTLDLNKFDNSDPDAISYDDELCKDLGMSLATLNKYLPRKLYPRDRNTGVIKGIKPRKVTSAAATPMATPIANYTSEPVIQPKVLETIVEESVATEADEAAEEAEVLEMAFKKSKKYKEPININDVVLSHHGSRIEAHDAISRLARTYEDLCPPLTYLGRPKRDLKPWFRDDIWIKHNSTLKEVKCPCCNIRIISSESFSAGHIQAESRGGSSQIDNIIPICKDCNGRMGSSHMYWFAWDRYGIVMFKV